MKDRVEEFIRNNKREFDQFDPPADVWARIEKQLDEQKINQPRVKPGRQVHLNVLLKMAATVIIVLGAGLFAYQYQKKESADISRIDPQLAKQQIHYASIIEEKRGELKSIEKEEPQLYQEFSSEIKKMEESYQKLKKDLPASPNQEETLKAMIRNLQIQAQLLNQQLSIIEQINRVKKEQDYESQSI